MDIEEAKARYCEQGYFIVDDAVQSDMLDQLDAAAHRVWDKVRSGAVDVGGNGPNTNGIFGVIAPEFGEPVFAQYLISEPVLRYVKPFLGEELQLGHVHIRCADKGYDTGWHRDVGRNRNVSYRKEMEILTRPIEKLKWQLPLLDDTCLWVVPGSHRRYRTEEEWRVLVAERKLDISGQRRIVLRRGQCLFWNEYLIHRGRQPDHLPKRVTLAASLQPYPLDGPLEEVDERLRWRLAGNLREALPPLMQLYYDRWLARQKI